MTQRCVRGWLVFALVMPLVGCGNLTKSPAEGLTFTAPAGFESKLSAMGMMQVWMNGSGDQILMLMRLPSPANEKDIERNTNLKDATVLKNEAITICGNEPARYLEIEGTHSGPGSNSSKESIIDTVVLTSPTAMFAAYVYPKGAAPNPGAQSALRELCSAPGKA